MPPRDENPSAEDITRFDRDLAYCPDCGAEIWDQADVCPVCYTYLAGETSRRRPAGRERRHGIRLLLIILLCLALSGLLFLR